MGRCIGAIVTPVSPPPHLTRFPTFLVLARIKKIFQNILLAHLCLLPGSLFVFSRAFDASYTAIVHLPAALLQGKDDDGEHRSSAIAGTGDSTRGRGGGVGGVRGGDEEPIEAELRLPEYGGPFSDYSEIVLQYGYITMFASALPIVTFFAIAEVLLQIRTDRSEHQDCLFPREP